MAAPRRVASGHPQYAENMAWQNRMDDYQTFAPQLRSLGYSDRMVNTGGGLNSYSWTKDGAEYSPNALANLHGFNLKGKYTNFDSRLAQPPSGFNPIKQAREYGPPGPGTQAHSMGRVMYTPPTAESLAASRPQAIRDEINKDKFQQLFAAGYRPDLSGYSGSSIRPFPGVSDYASAQWYHAPDTISKYDLPQVQQTADGTRPRKGKFFSGHNITGQYDIGSNTKLGSFKWKPSEGAQGFSFEDALGIVRGPTTTQFEEQGGKLSGIASQLGDYGTQMGELQSQFGQRGETLSDLQSQFGQRGETISGMQEQIGGFGKQFTQMNEGIGSLTSQYGDMQKLLNNFQSQTAQFSGGIQDQLGRMEGRIGQLEQNSQMGGGGFGGNNFNPVYPGGGGNYTQPQGYGGSYMPLNFGTGLNIPNSGGYPSSAYYGGISPFMFGFY